MLEVRSLAGHSMPAAIRSLECKCSAENKLIPVLWFFFAGLLCKGVMSANKGAVHRAGLIGVFLALTVPTILSNSS